MSESATKPVKTVGEKAERRAGEDQSNAVNATMKKKREKSTTYVKEVFDFT